MKLIDNLKLIGKEAKSFGKFMYKESKYISRCLLNLLGGNVQNKDHFYDNE